MDHPAHKTQVREHWSSRLGIILAVAGSAVGLGNFLRFPAKAVANGGGAFMIPYFVSLLLLGIPLMWIEWTLGRYGGGIGCSTAPALFHHICRQRWTRYVGLLGILGPLLIFSYYTYIESWTLAYSFFALTGKISGIDGQAGMQDFLQGFQGLEHNEFFSGLGWAYGFFLLTFLINMITIYFGIRAGIERFCQWAMPVLFICAAAFFLRILTMGMFHSPQFEWTVLDGFGFFWNPQLSFLKSARVWLEAAGQVFFTLSVGIGVIFTYATYLSRKQDVALSGLTAVSANEIAEVILGGSIVIPAAFMLFGPQDMQAIVSSGIFNLGFVTMPLVLNHLPWSALLGFIWFSLLFLAAVTSSISLAQPFLSFLEDEFQWSRQKAVLVFGLLMFFLCQPAILFLKNGAVDELDFWGGSFCLVVFATVETILFGWVWGIDRAWKELHEGADIKIPGIFKFIIKYVTPVFLLTILGVWCWQEWLPMLFLKNVPAENRWYVVGIRLGIIALFVGLAFLVKASVRHRQKEQ
jgi:SNF family Na+-dependent transporter